MDVEILARIQFAFTIAFHYIYPPLSIGLGLIMVFMEGMYIKTGNKQYEILTRFWLVWYTFSHQVSRGKSSGPAFSTDVSVPNHTTL